MNAVIVQAVFTVLFGCSAVVSQRLPPSDPTKSSTKAEAEPTNCEHRIAVLDGITQNAPATQNIIVVSRLGDGDEKGNLSWRRLNNVRTYWTQFLPEDYRRKRETIVLATGERVSGFGQLEFYVGGELVYVMKIARNADLYIGECYPPDDSYIKGAVFDPCEVKGNKIFYPCRDKGAGRGSRVK